MARTREPPADREAAIEPDSELVLAAHELRTPLHAIKGNVEILIRGEAGTLSCVGRTSLADLARAVRDLEAAVERWLMLSKARRP